MKKETIEMTGFDSANLQAVFNTEPKVKTFRIGELVAETILQYRYNAIFTYNSDRDLKNPNSNNTGADLVGFIEQKDGTVNFLFGEVKTSAEEKYPPGVMYRSDGMIEQLIELSETSDKVRLLIKWLLIKFHSQQDNQNEKYIKEAMKYYAKDSRNVQLIGVLVRDTQPNEKDLKNRYKDLKKKVDGRQRVQLLAVYANYKMKNAAWEQLI